jgi:hypothetical protein
MRRFRYFLSYLILLIHLQEISALELVQFSSPIPSKALSSDEFTHDLFQQRFSRPICSSVFSLPWECYDESLVFFQRSTNRRIQGLDNLRRNCQQWDDDLMDELTGNKNKDDTPSHRFLSTTTTTLQRISRISPTTIVLQWNVSFVPPTAQWLLNMARICNWSVDLRPYHQQSHRIKTFSYLAIVKLFSDAVATQELRIPLACIEGTTVCELNSQSQIVSMTEDLSFAQDLRRGRLQNRQCGQDLQLFLEICRRPIDQARTTWEENVLNILPWSTVPGLTDPLAIEPMTEVEERLVPTIFLGAVAICLLSFACVLAPELYGLPTNLVSPQDLNDIIFY